MLIMEFEPDASQAEADLIGFKFLGPGWYEDAHGTTLVIPDADVKYPFGIGQASKGPWRSSWPADQVFWVCYYEGRNPFNAFNALANAPTRQLEE